MTMSLRGKLLLSQTPHLIALLCLSVIAFVTVSSIGDSAHNIIHENYRSVLATQRMKESIERMDRGALFLVAGQRGKGTEQAAQNRERFESELRVEEENITEAGEADAARKLRMLWAEYQHRFDELSELKDAVALQNAYFSAVEPAYLAVKGAADEILGMNQEAMVRKSERAQRSGQTLRQLTASAAGAAIVLGILTSLLLTERLLRPLARLSLAAHRIGEGDLESRAQVDGTDELARLATDFNVMAEHLQRYRNSSLGELLATQHAAQSTIDSIPDPVILFDSAGGVLSTNQAAESVLGVDPSGTSMEPIGRLDPSLRSVLERVRGHVLSGKGSYSPRDFTEAQRIESIDGHRYVLPRATPLYDVHGGLQGATVILQDVTRLRRFDELKDDLVATVAHELRTPLTSLRMAVHLCLEGVVGNINDQQAKLLDTAREDCERLQLFIDDLLDLARLQAGKVEMRKVSLPIADLLEGAIADQDMLAKQHQVTLKPELSPLVPEEISVDPERLSLVFANLIGNAIRHTPEGGSVTVRAKETIAKTTVRFEIQDTGTGIPLEYQDEIFQKFFRVPGSTAGSAGLGLSIAKEIVEAHGGEIGVESQPGIGSTFYFTLPAASYPQSRSSFQWSASIGLASRDR